MKELATLFVSSFKGKNLYAHISAYILTYLLVISGLDWKYFLIMNNLAPRYILFSADILGYIFPFLLIVFLFTYGKINKKTHYINLSFILIKTVVTAFLVALLYKSFTGRISPPDHGILIDTSNQWNFGFMDYSVLGGWPSTHAMVMFAIASSLVTLYPKSYLLHVLIYILALYVGIGVSIEFHWLSELLSGIIIGTIIGITVVNKSINAK